LERGLGYDGNEDEDMLAMLSLLEQTEAEASLADGKGERERVDGRSSGGGGARDRARDGPPQPSAWGSGSVTAHAPGLRDGDEIRLYGSLEHSVPMGGYRGEVASHAAPPPGQLMATFGLGQRGNEAPSEAQAGRGRKSGDWSAASGGGGSVGRWGSSRGGGDLSGVAPAGDARRRRSALGPVTQGHGYHGS